MLIVSIFFACLISFIFVSVKIIKDSNEVFESILSMLLNFLFHFLIWIFLSFTCLYCIPRTSIIEQDKIVSLISKDQMSGSFVLGCGNVGEIEYYYFYKDLGNDNYKRDRVNVSECIIEENDNISPCFQYEKVVPKNPNYQSFELFTKNKKLIVPKNTIIRSFTLS
jgi:hypothetical protein